MAKNKNRDRKQPQAERAQRAAQASTMETPDEQRTTQAVPGEVGRGKGRQKRFGHNRHLHNGPSRPGHMKTRAHEGPGT